MRNRKIMILIAMIAVSALCLSCETPYVPPQVGHTYMTNTQQSHRLTGITLICSSGTLHHLVEQTLSATKLYQDWYIDGRKILTQQAEQSFETFVQLPPGEHELVIAPAMRGVITLGMKSGYGPPVIYEFVLEDGARAEFRMKGFDHSDGVFTGVKSFRKKESKVKY